MYQSLMIEEGEVFIPEDENEEWQPVWVSFITFNTGGGGPF